MNPIRVTGDEAEVLSRPRGYHWVPNPSPDWSACADGSWWLVHHGGDESDFRKAFERIKRGSKLWAKRNSKTRSIRRLTAERKIWVRFTSEADHE